jgi:hypothetical protein
MNVHVCSRCHTTNNQVLQHSLVACKNCGALVVNTLPGLSISHHPVPPDWSFICVGSSFNHDGKQYSVLGRVRLQLRNDYKNMWYCISSSGNENVWLMDSFGSLAIMRTEWREFKDHVSKLHAGHFIKVGNDSKIVGEFVEKCEEISYEGEVAEWHLAKPGFFFIQAGNARIVGVFTVVDQLIHFVLGEKVELAALELKNIMEWNEWK